MSDLSIHWLVTALDASLKAGLIAVTAALVLLLTRVRDSNLRHRVWTGVLIGMLAMPLLSQVVPALRLPFAIDLGWLVSRWEREQVAALSLADSADGNPARMDLSESQPIASLLAADELDIVASPPAMPSSAASSFAPSAEFQPFAGDGFNAPRPATEIEPSATASLALIAESPEAGALPTASAGGNPVAPAEPVSAAGVMRPTPSWFEPTLARWPQFLFTLWLSVAVVLLLRLSTALIAGRWLLRSARAIERVDFDDLGLPSSLVTVRGRSVPVLECERLRVPITLGWTRPRILLPLDWMEWSTEKLAAVLTHERTHVERKDCAVMFLAELNRCIAWFHPLAWWLKRHLSALAEAACDDAVIGTTGDRATYARHLLEVASVVSRHRGRVLLTGVSMARKSNVENRIHSILDAGRPLTQRLTRATTLLLVGVIVPVIALAAALKPAKISTAVEATTIPPFIEAGFVNEFPASIDREGAGVTAANPGATIETGDVNNEEPPVILADAGTLPSLSQTDSSPDSSQTSSDTVFEYSGTVVDEAGKPVTGANISLNYYRRSAPAKGAAPMAVTNRHGKFQFSRKKSDFADGGEDRVWTYATLVAEHDGHGFAARQSLAFETTGRAEAELPEQSRAWIAEQKKSWTNTLKLPVDLPVRGRIVNTEGQPVPGATVEPINIWEGKTGSLEAWLAETEQPQGNYYSARSHLSHLVHGNFVSGPSWSVIPPVTTDADGWFTLSGLGRERIAEVIIGGPGIESIKTYVRSQAGESVRLSKSERGDDSADVDTYYPAEFTHVAGPSQPVMGRITDARTGEPVAGARVRSDRLANKRTGGILAADFIRTVSDIDGRYRLEGLPLGENEFVVLPPRGSTYLAGEVPAKTSVEQSELVRDIRLTPGVLVRGRAIDGATGAPLRGHVEAFVFSNNPQLKQLPTRIGGDVRNEYVTDADGRFEIPVLPGPGVLTFMADDHQKYPRGAGADQIEGPSQMIGLKAFQTQPSYCIPSNHHALAAVDFEPGADPQTIDFKLGSGATITGRIVDANGQPLTDCYLFGENAFSSWYQHPPAEFTVEGYFPREGRRLMAYHPATNVIGERMLSGEPPAGPVELKVTQQVGKLTGRLIDDDGEPIAGATLTDDEPSRMQMAAGGEDSTEDLGRGFLLTRIDGRPVATDGVGRFELIGLIPGRRYSARAMGLRDFGGEKYQSDLGGIFADITVEPGETKDLGDLRPILEPSPKEQPLILPTQGQSDTASSQRSATIAGVVLKPDGSPAVGAVIRTDAEWWKYWQSNREGDGLSVSMEAIAGNDGKFSLDLPFGPPEQLSASEEDWQRIRQEDRWKLLWQQSRLAASLPGFGATWIRLEDDFSRPAITLQLTDEFPLRGRVIDLEGRPLAGVTVQLSNCTAGKAGSLDPWLTAIKAGEPAWTSYKQAGPSVAPKLIGLPDELLTDAEGRFTIRHLGPEQKVDLTFHSEQVAHRTAVACSRVMPAESRTIISQFSEIAEPVFGDDFTFSADPARLIEGIVQDAATGQPLAGVAVESYKLHGYPFSNHRVLKTVTDRDGKFRIVGMPKGSDNQLLALPPDGMPFLMRRIDVADPVGLGPVETTIELHRGVLITGQVTDKDTGAGVPDCRLHYLPLRTNAFAQELPEFDRDGNTDGDQMRYTTDSDGRFQLVGLPGPAIVGVESVYRPYRMGVGYDEIKAPRYGKSDWISTYRNPINPGPKWPSTMREVDISADAETFSLDLQLDPGSSLKLHVLDEQGQPVTDATAQGLARQMSGANTGDSVLMAINLGPQEQRSIIVRHDERRLGRVVRVGAKEIQAEEMTVTLQPFATIRGRLLRDDHSPAAGLVIESMVLPNEDFSPSLSAVTTAADGKFEVALIPGCGYTLGVTGRGVRGLGMIAKDLQITPGETHDFGDLVQKKDGFVPVKQPEQAVSAASNRMPAAMPRPAGGGGVAAGVKSADSEPMADKTSHQPLRVTGRVQNEQGQPLAGVALRTHIWTNIPPITAEEIEFTQLTVSDANGRFEVVIDQPQAGAQVSPKALSLFACGDGYGSEWAEIPRDGSVTTSDFTLRPEQLVQGRLLTTEGQPIAGVKVKIGGLSVPKEGEQLDAFLQAWLREHNTAYMQLRSTWGLMSPAFDAVTDADGKFTLRGLPADSVARCQLSGEDIAGEMLTVINRAGLNLQPYVAATMEVGLGPMRPQSVVATEFTHICEPEAVLKGKITDAAGRPVAGTMVSTVTSSGHSVNGRTDEMGEYRLTGLQRGTELFVSCGRWGDDSAFLPQTIPLTIGSDGAEQVQDVVLERGIVITGRVLDPTTGEGVAGGIRYSPLAGNEFAHKPGFNGRERDRTMDSIHADGSYRLVVLPGPGLLLVQAHGHVEVAGEQRSPYRQAVVSNADRERLGEAYNENDSYISTAYGQDSLRTENVVRVIDVQLDDDPRTFDLTLDRGRTLDVEIVDPDGTPATRVCIAGVTEHWPLTAKLTDSRCTLLALGPDRPRTVLALDVKRNLVGKLVLTGEEPSPVKLQLQPAATIKGRAIDADGNPIADESLGCNYFSTVASELLRFHGAGIDEVRTDAEGRFTLTHVLPTELFNLDMQPENGENLRAQARPELVKTLGFDKGVRRLIVPQGGEYDFGDLLFGPPFGEPLKWPESVQPIKDAGETSRSNDE